MSEIITLDGNIREDLGSAATRRLRRADRLPAVIYTGEAENVFVDLDLKKFETEYFKGGIETKIIELKTPKKTYKVLTYKIDLDPVSDRPSHIDFMSIEGKKEVKVLVPVKLLNKEKCPGLKKSGFLNFLHRKLQLICDVNNIPNKVELDVGTLRLKQAIMASQVKLPEGTRLASKKDYMVINVTGRGKDDETPAAQAAAATTATNSTKSETSSMN